MLGVRDLLGLMVDTVVTERHLPHDEVRRWRWKQLLTVYREIGRRQWERFLSDTQSAEMGTLRAIAAAFGSKNIPPLPEYEDVAHDPWEPQDAAPRRNVNTLWEAYKKAAEERGETLPEVG